MTYTKQQSGPAGASSSENSIVEEDGVALIPIVWGQTLLSGIKTVTGSIPAKFLADKYKIPYRDALRKEGYQRKPQQGRINKLMSELRKRRVDIAPSVLMNMRGSDWKDFLVVRNDQLYLRVLLDNSHQKFHIVDGQHRVLAIIQLCEEDFDRWANFKLQFVMMLGASEKEEVNQFYVVNSTAKSVRTDLAIDLLKQRAEADGRIMDEAIESGQQWKIDGQTLVDRLFQDSVIWRNKIRLANEPKAETLIPAASFISSLKPLTRSPYFSALNDEQKYRLIESYWEGIRAACREPFDGDSNDYTLQKGIGVNTMHEVLVLVIEHLRSNGESVFDSDAYARVLSPVLDGLEGDNKDGENVSGPDFWLTAPMGGAAGSYSSSAGKRVLSAKLRRLLPEMEVE